MYDEKSKKDDDGFFKKHWKKIIALLCSCPLVSVAIVSVVPKAEFSVVDISIFENPPEALDDLLRLWCNSIIDGSRGNEETKGSDVEIEPSKKTVDNEIIFIDVANKSDTVPDLPLSTADDIPKGTVAVFGEGGAKENGTEETDVSIEKTDTSTEETEECVPPQLDAKYEPTNIPWIY